MADSIEQKIQKRFEALISEGAKLVSQMHAQDDAEHAQAAARGVVIFSSFKTCKEDFASYKTRCLSLIGRLGAQDSHIKHVVQEVRSLPGTPADAERLVGTMRGLADDFAYGMLEPGHDDDSEESGPVGVHHHGDIIMGDKLTSKITGGVVGASALGRKAHAIGTANAQQNRLTHEQHRAAVKEAQKALLDDEDRLDPLVYEALGQFLRLAREIQVEQRALVEVQAAMTAALDRVWVQQKKPPALPQTLEVVGALAKHPAAGGVVKKLLGGVGVR